MSCKQFLSIESQTASSHVCQLGINWQLTQLPHYICRHILTHTHTHPFNGPLSGTTQVSWYQKGKTNLDFTEWQWHQLGHMQVCTSLQTENHASTPPLIFLQAGCPSCRPTNSVKALKAKSTEGMYILSWQLTENVHFVMPTWQLIKTNEGDHWPQWPKSLTWKQVVPISSNCYYSNTTRHTWLSELSGSQELPPVILLVLASAAWLLAMTKGPPTPPGSIDWTVNTKCPLGSCLRTRRRFTIMGWPAELAETGWLGSEASVQKTPELVMVGSMLEQNTVVQHVKMKKAQQSNQVSFNLGISY